MTSYAEFGSAWNRVNAVYESFARSQGLSFNGMLVFAHICCSEGITQKEAGERALLSKQTANSIVKVLREQGLIELRVLEGDRRSKGIFLTDEGRQFASRTVDRIAAAERTALESLAPEVREAMVGGLSTYATAFHKELLGE